MRRARLGLGVGAIGISGFAYQALATAIDARRYPPLGRLVDVNGHRLHVHALGEGTPTVVMDAGLSGCCLDWCLVQREVAKFTRACVYDRAGSGWSDPYLRRRTSLGLAYELRTLLVNAEVDGPYVMVGHSFGGYTVRLYSSSFPTEVSGLVLVDAAHEDQRARMPRGTAWARALGKLQWWRFHLKPFLARLGWMRLTRQPNGGTDGLPADLHPMAIAVGLRSSAYDWVLTDAGAMGQSDAQVRGSGPLQDIPLVALAAHIRHSAEGVPADILDAVFMELQSELATLSSRGKLVVVEESGHFIQLDQPGSVVEAIREVVTAARKSAP